jgi:hypothetical protein
MVVVENVRLLVDATADAVAHETGTDTHASA